MFTWRLANSFRGIQRRETSSSPGAARQSGQRECPAIQPTAASPAARCSQAIRPSRTCETRLLRYPAPGHARRIPTLLLVLLLGVPLAVTSARPPLARPVSAPAD